MELYNNTGEILLGILGNAISATVEEERNGNFELIVSYPISDDLYLSLEEENIIVANANDTLKDQKFVIYKVSKYMKNQITVYARHISFDLMHDILENEVSFENQSCEYALNEIFRNSISSKHYRGFSDIVNAQAFKVSKINCLSAIAGTKGSIIDTFGTGAEILRDNTNIHVLNRRGRDNDVSIEYRKNLTGLSVDEDTSELVTRIKAYATQRDIEGNETIVTYKGYIDAPNIDKFSKPFSKWVDYSDKFEQGEGITEEKLKIYAEREYTVNKVHIPKCNYKLEFIPLSKVVGYEGLEDRISLCDTVTIKDTRYNINTQAKVIKTVYNVLLERYDSIELGEPKTALGDIISGITSSNTSSSTNKPNSGSGKDDVIIDLDKFPNTLPAAPVLTGECVGFQSVSLSWTYENKLYYTYELYASKTKDFTPNSFNLIFEGQASTFTREVNPGETWYYKACAKNTYGNRTEFSNQIAVTTTKIENFDQYFSSLAVKNLVTNIFSADYMQAGIIKGDWIDAKNLSVTDGNGKRTFNIDSFGRVYLDVADMKINSADVATCNWVKQEINPQYILTSVRKDSDYIEDISNPDNIILNSNFQNDIKNWNKHGQVHIDCNPSWMNYEHRMVYFHVNNDGLEECSNGVYQHFYTQIGQEYTVTFYAEADHMTPTNVYIGVEGVELVGLTNAENAKYKRHLIRFTAEKGTYAFIAYGGRNTKFYLGNVMIQRGHVTRDWKASSRDVDLLVDTVNTLTEFKQTSEKFEFKVKTQGINNLVKNSSFENANGVITAKSGDVRNVLITKSANEVVLNDNFLYLQGEGIPGDVFVETSLHFIAEPGETYTISADTRFATLGAFASSSSYIKISNDYFHIFENENFSYQWHRVYTTWTCPSNIGGTAYIRLGYRCADYSWGCYNNIKVEKGDVATPWCTADNEINEGITSIDENGVTVKHSNGSSASFNYNGSIWRDAYGKEILRINGQGMEYISPDNGVWTAFMKSSKRTTNFENKGVSFATSGNGAYVSMGCSKQTDPKASWEVSSGISMENTWIGDFPPGVHVWAMNTVERNGCCLHNHTDYIQESGSIFMNNQSIYFGAFGSSNPNWIGRTTTGRLGVFGDNEVVLGTRHGTTNRSAILITEGDNYDFIKSWCPWDMNGYTLSNARVTYSVANTKTRSFTEDTVLKSNTESTRYIYTDMQIKNNKLVLSIPNTYKGCAYTICSIVKKGQADVWVAEEKENYFKIMATEDIRVNVEIDIKEKEIAMATTFARVKEDVETNKTDCLNPQGRD